MEIEEKIDKCILEEERGVANFKYNNVIKEIIEFCDSYSPYLAQQKGFLKHGEMQNAKKNYYKIQGS